MRTSLGFACLSLLALLLAGPALAAEEEKPKPPPAHSDQQAEQALTAYASGFDSKDMDVRLKAVRALGRWRHKEVLKELKRVLVREEDLELKAAAAEGFQHQQSHALEAARIVAEQLKAWEKWAGLDDPADPKVEERQKYEARVLSALWVSAGALGWKEPWKDWKGYIDHAHDEVAAAAIQAFGRLKEYRALAPLLEWFNLYPDGLSWSGGSVSVDTGAAGGADQAAAEAKWRAKYGNKKKKARPAVVESMLKALKDITGQEFTKPEQLKDWMQENKVLLRKHGA